MQQLVALGKYEEALGVSFNASRASVTRAHIRQLHHFSHSESTREALNRAKITLLDESIERKTQRLLNLGQMEAAFLLLEGHIDEHATAYNYYMLGYILYRMDRYVESATYMEKAFGLNDSPFHAIWLGCAWERQGKLRRALKYYLFAIEKRGHETEYRMAGNLYFHVGELSNALHHLQRAIELGAKDEDVFEKVSAIQQKQKLANLKDRVKRFFRVHRSNESA